MAQLLLLQHRHGLRLRLQPGEDPRPGPLRDHAGAVLHVVRPVPAPTSPAAPSPFPYKWVMYDPENWAATPVNEQQDPVKYMTLFGQLAHANGLKVIPGPRPRPGHRHRLGPPRGRRASRPTSGSSGSTSPGKALAAGGISPSSRTSSNTTCWWRYPYMYNTTAKPGAGRERQCSRCSPRSRPANGTAAQMATAAEVHQPLWSSRLVAVVTSRNNHQVLAADEHGWLMKAATMAPPGGARWCRSRGV